MVRKLSADRRRAPAAHRIAALSLTAVAAATVFGAEPLTGDAEIHGVVRGVDGAPLPKVYVAAVREATEPSLKRSVTALTDAQGKYAFPGLTNGRYRLRLESWDGKGLSDEIQLELQEKEVRAIDVDFSRRTRVAGKLTTGPSKATPTVSLVRGKGGDGRLYLIEPMRDGSYSLYLEPGDYSVAALNEVFGLCPTGDTVTVSPSPKEQSVDIDVALVDVKVEIAPPAGVGVGRGTLTAEYRTLGNAETTRIDWGQPAYEISALPAGEYRIGFTMLGGMQGLSPLTAVGPAKENVLRIPLASPAERTYVLTVKVPPGRYDYKFFAPPDTWVSDLSNPAFSGEGETSNSVLIVPDPGGSASKDGPRVNPSTGEVTFRVRVPAVADEVYVRGTFNKWAIDPAFRMTAEKGN